jgi:glycogen debranching enzyme
VREVSFTLSAAPAAPEPAPVAAALEAARAAYERGRARSAGAPAGAAEALTQNLHWMVLARPDTGRLYVPAGRRWLSRRADGAAEDWTIFEWDGFFNALLLSVEAPELAREMLLAVLETQYPNGNVPNYRSASRGSADRSQPPVGALCTLKLWGRLGGDRELLERAWMPLYAWHRWWRASGPRGKPRRDGNGNGLLEWGTDPATPAWEKWRPYDRARFESGMDDSPLWDDAALDASSGCLALDAVDLNSLYALDAWCLGRIAEELGRVDEASALFQEYEEVRGRMNRLLWDDVAGFYFDLHWEGRRSRRRAASSFYPLLAGIPTPDRAARMIERLRDPRQFWGEHVLPTISRDDRAFEQQQYWRGTIWPPTNYLVTLGLRRYGYEEEAAALAAAGARLFLESWRRHGLCRENHDARTGAGGGHRFQSWGPLFVLSALEEAADWDPWGGVRFGSFGADAAEHTGLRVGGHAYELRRGPDGFELRRDGAPWLRANVPAAITGLSASDGEVRFQTRAPRAGRLTIGDRELELPAGTRDWKLPDTLSAR